MATSQKNLSETNISNLCKMEDKVFGIVVSDWNEKITYKLKDGCIDTLINNGVLKKHIHVVHVPGSFELPMGARLLAGKEKLNAVICIGCVIKGETKHDEYINNAVANGIMNLSLTSGKPVIFGVLTPNDLKQAEDRAGGKHGNKGVEAAATALRMVSLAQGLKDSEAKIGFN